jgi:3-oxoacyl-[acyl-carrier protein] reductase
MGELDGRVAIVTGAAGGIGAGITRRLSEAGAIVVLTDYDAERLAAAEQVAADNPDGGEVTSLGADLTVKAEVEELVAKTLERYGRLDILVNNAGVLRTGPVVDIPEEDWNLVITANLNSAFFCSQAALPHMIENRRGAIVNIVSVAGFAFTTPHAHYAASKAGMAAFSRDLAYEAASHGIRVNAIAPSAVVSPMNQEVLAPEVRKTLEDAIPLGRWGEPEDVGDAVVFLASDRAAFVVGACLSVAGGSDLSILPQMPRG